MRSRNWRRRWIWWSKGEVFTHPTPDFVEGTPPCRQGGEGEHRMYSTRQIALIISRDLRKKQTKAEHLFWNKIKNKQFLGYKFLRQHPLFYEYYDKEKFFIADFYCRELKLIIEIDGGIHEQQKEYDKIRTEILDSQNDLKVMRFKNEEILDDINFVLKNLQNSIIKLPKISKR
jgi:very-short-patch-repair endonuclease